MKLYWKVEISCELLNSFGLLMEIIFAFCGTRCQSDQLYSLSWLWPAFPFGLLQFGLYLLLSSRRPPDVVERILRLTMPHQCQQSWASRLISLSLGFLIWNIKVLKMIFSMSPSNPTLYASPGACLWNLSSSESLASCNRGRPEQIQDCLITSSVFIGGCAYENKQVKLMHLYLLLRKTIKLELILENANAGFFHLEVILEGKVCHLNKFAATT